MDETIELKEVVRPINKGTGAGGLIQIIMENGLKKKQIINKDY